VFTSVPRRSIVRGLCAALVLCATPLRAHEVPRHVSVRAFVATAADRVRLLVQIPLEAVRDVEFPLRADGTLDVARAAPFLRDAARLWVADAVALRNGNAPLPAPSIVAVRAALPGDRAFEQFTTARDAVLQQPLADSVRIAPGQLRLEVLMDVPTTGEVRDLVIEPHWANLGVRTSSVLRTVNSAGIERAYTWEGDPGALRLDPRWWHAAGRFVREGLGHMLGGFDHLLFVFCLVLPFRRLRPLIGIVTAFTVAHSLTLIAAALGYAPDANWFAPLVEVLIAVSIVYMALENIVGAKLERRWMMAFAFGLVHGFGFSSALQGTLQFAGAHLYTSLAAFNVGVELAQLLVLVAVVPLLNALFARAVPERTGIIIASALVTHEAWHWMLERGAALRAYSFTIPALDATFAANVVALLMAAGVALGCAWLVSSFVTRLQRWKLSPLFVLAAGLLLVGTTPLRAQTTARTTMSGVYTTEQATKGKEVFMGSCMGCHTTASHTGPAFQLKWFGRPLYDLFDYVSGLMPKSAPGSLTEDEYVWVMAYILRLNGMPSGKTELSAEPSVLKAVRIDTTARSTGAGERLREAPVSRFRQLNSAGMEHP
jgi:mono/diheme cytochrome c family protein